jgi:hypothetical protein
MSRSRWGGFRKGKNLYTKNWLSLQSPSAETASTPTSPVSFDYTTAQGIWDLSSTVQFQKTGELRYELGLSNALLSVSGNNNAWVQRTVDISAYANATVRLVFHATNGGGFNSDFQVDAIDLDGAAYSFENQTHGFETSTNNSGTYAGVSWNNIAVESGNNGAWQVDSGGTPSGSTGRNDAADGTFYVYSESSSPANVAGYNFWLRSPEVVLGSTPSLTFFEARAGANIGTLTVYLEVIA